MEHNSVMRCPYLCNFCKSVIRVERYKCLNCIDFDVCAKCINLSDQCDQHQLNHVLVRLQIFENGPESLYDGPHLTHEENEEDQMQLELRFLDAFQVFQLDVHSLANQVGLPIGRVKEKMKQLLTDAWNELLSEGNDEQKQLNQDLPLIDHEILENMPELSHELCSEEVLETIEVSDAVGAKGRNSMPPVKLLWSSIERLVNDQVEGADEMMVIEEMLDDSLRYSDYRLTLILRGVNFSERLPSRYFATLSELATVVSGVQPLPVTHQKDQRTLKGKVKEAIKKCSRTRIRKALQRLLQCYSSLRHQSSEGNTKALNRKQSSNAEELKEIPSNTVLVDFALTAETECAGHSLPNSGLSCLRGDMDPSSDAAASCDQTLLPLDVTIEDHQTQAAQTARYNPLPSVLLPLVPLLPVDGPCDFELDRSYTSELLQRPFLSLYSCRQFADNHELLQGRSRQGKRRAKTVLEVTRSEEALMISDEKRRIMDLIYSFGGGKDSDESGDEDEEGSVDDYSANHAEAEDEDDDFDDTGCGGESSYDARDIDDCGQVSVDLGGDNSVDDASCCMKYSDAGGSDELLVLREESANTIQLMSPQIEPYSITPIPSLETTADAAAGCGLEGIGQVSLTPPLPALGFQRMEDQCLYTEIAEPRNLNYDVRNIEFKLEESNLKQSSEYSPTAKPHTAIDPTILHESVKKGDSHMVSDGEAKDRRPSSIVAGVEEMSAEIFSEPNPLPSVVLPLVPLLPVDSPIDFELDRSYTSELLQRPFLSLYSCRQFADNHELLQGRSRQGKRRAKTVLEATRSEWGSLETEERGLKRMQGMGEGTGAQNDSSVGEAEDVMISDEKRRIMDLIYSFGGGKDSDDSGDEDGEGSVDDSCNVELECKYNGDVNNRVVVTSTHSDCSITSVVEENTRFVTPAPAQGHRNEFISLSDRVVVSASFSSLSAAGSEESLLCKRKLLDDMVDQSE